MAGVVAAACHSCLEKLDPLATLFRRLLWLVATGGLGAIFPFARPVRNVCIRGYLLFEVLLSYFSSFESKITKDTQHSLQILTDKRASQPLQQTLLIGRQVLFC